LPAVHTLIPVMKQRLASPSDVIDLGRIKETRRHRRFRPTRVTIKAATHRTTTVATSGTCAKKRSLRSAYLASL